jgi:hypothetical protein
MDNSGCLLLRENCVSTGHQKKIRKPKPWMHSEVITLAQLKQMRDEFWDTAPHYGGQKGELKVVILGVEFFLFFFQML